MFTSNTFKYVIQNKNQTRLSVVPRYFTFIAIFEPLFIFTWIDIQNQPGA